MISNIFHKKRWQIEIWSTWERHQSQDNKNLEVMNSCFVYSQLFVCKKGAKPKFCVVWVILHFSSEEFKYCWCQYWKQVFQIFLDFLVLKETKIVIINNLFISDAEQYFQSTVSVFFCWDCVRYQSVALKRANFNAYLVSLKILVFFLQRLNERF